METTGKKRTFPGDRLKAYREAKGYSQQQVADMVSEKFREKGIDSSLSQESYVRYEKNVVKRWPLATMECLAEIYGTTADEILGTADPFKHFPQEIRDWLETKESLPFVQEAFFEFKRQQWKSEQ